MASETGDKDLYFPGHELDNDHVALRRLRRRALLGEAPGVDPDSIEKPRSIEVPVVTVEVLSGGKVALNKDGTPQVRHGAVVLEERPQRVTARVREDQVEEYESTSERNESGERVRENRARLYREEGLQ